MKKIKWLRKLPVLLLALILVVMPLSMAAPAYADVLTDVSSYYLYLHETSGSTYVELPYGVENLPGIFVLNVSDFGLEAYYLTGVGVDFDRSSNVATCLLGSIYSYTGELSADGNKLIFSFYDPVYVDLWYEEDLSGFSGLVVYGIDIPDTRSFKLGVNGPGVLSVFSGVGSWLSRAVQNISTMFWTAESGMTVLGYLAVASLALAVILLIFSLIAGWLKFH